MKMDPSEKNLQIVLELINRMIYEINALRKEKQLIDHQVSDYPPFNDLSSLETDKPFSIVWKHRHFRINPVVH